MKTLPLTILAVLIIAIALPMSGCAYVNDAQQTIYKEVKLSSILDKYEWFKEASNSLEAKKADIAVYDAKIKKMYDQYNGTPRKDWARTDREQVNQWETEQMGIKNSYNSLASEYNARMESINWAFCNTALGGDVTGLVDENGKPVYDAYGNRLTALPREYAPYIVS